MRHFFFTVAQVFGLVLLADFVAGVVHWLEDAYGTEDTPVVGPLLIRPNIVHHHFPRFFTKLSWWQSSWDLVLLGALGLGIAWWFDALSWQLALFTVVGVNANQVHKWAHRTRAENGPVISFFQDIYVLQGPRQHAIHHTDPKNTYYCPVTNVLNPVLEKIQFWPRAEKLIERVTGLRHRDDTSLRGNGPGPEWLAEYRPTHPAPAAATMAAKKPTVCDCGNCKLQGKCGHAKAA